MSTAIGLALNLIQGCIIIVATVAIGAIIILVAADATGDYRARRAHRNTLEYEHSNYGEHG